MPPESSDKVAGSSVLNSPSAVLSGPSNASNLIDAEARAVVTKQTPNYLLIGGLVIAAVYIVTRWKK